MLIKSNNLSNIMLITAFLTVINSPLTYADKDKHQLRGEQETPDLLIDPSPIKDPRGDDKIYLKHKNAKKIDTQITPDLLEQSLDKTSDDNADTTLQELLDSVTNPKLSKEELAIKKRSQAASRLQIPPDLNSDGKKDQRILEPFDSPERVDKNRNELITPDPLLDNM